MPAVRVFTHLLPHLLLPVLHSGLIICSVNLLKNKLKHLSSIRIFFDLPLDYPSTLQGLTGFWGFGVLGFWLKQKKEPRESL